MVFNQRISHRRARSDGASRIEKLEFKKMDPKKNFFEKKKNRGEERKKISFYPSQQKQQAAAGLKSKKSNDGTQPNQLNAHTRTHALSLFLTLAPGYLSHSPVSIPLSFRDSSSLPFSASLSTFLSISLTLTHPLSLSLSLSHFPYSRYELFFSCQRFYVRRV